MYKKIEDLQCPNCNAYLSFTTIIDKTIISRRIQCVKCLEILNIKIEAKEIKRWDELI